ncbi:MAG: hypothetical protein MJZ65_02015 [Paludibacteraceae bacterium]|nr:hypothetical protein [Paludibacteraceae bacterium]
MKKVVYLALVAVMALATSCVSQHNVNRAYTPAKPDIVRMNVTMADYDYLGDVTMEVTYKRYGLITKVLTINGDAYDPRNYTVTNIDFTNRIAMSKWMRQACYKVVETYPNADYIMPVSARNEYEHMFGGRNVKEILTVKVFALKKKSVTEKAAEMEAFKAQMEAKHNNVAAENAQLKAQLQKVQEELDLQKRINEANKNAKRTR